MKFEWHAYKQDFKTITQLLCDDVVLCEIEQVDGDEYCYLWEGKLDFLFADINSSFDFVAQAKCEVERRLHEFCVGYNTWWQREDKK